MINNRYSVAQDVAAEIVPLEANLDKAIVRSAQLQIAIVQGRRRGRLRLDAGQASLDKVVAAHAQLLAARAAVHEAHYELRTLRGEIGVVVIADDFGDFGDTPTSNTLDDMAEPSLRIVA